MSKIKLFLKIAIKHIIKKLFNIADPYWSLYFFEKNISKESLSKYEEVKNWGLTMLKNESKYDNFIEHNVLGQESLKTSLTYRNKYADFIEIRILIYIPSVLESPGGNSLFSNFAKAFEFVGISVKTFSDYNELQKIIIEFKPTIFLFSDNSIFTQKIDWKLLSNYKKNNKFFIGLTTSLEEYGNSPLIPRLEWAKNNDIDFYYSFKDIEYVKTRREYKPYFDFGYKILPLEFGVNPLIYYPVSGIEKDLDFVFLGSNNFSKLSRYQAYFKSIFKKNVGYIDGPGWFFNNNNLIMIPEDDKYYYARARVGLNLSIPEQIEWACELNERTYMLAACCIPQLTDRPKLLSKRFSDDCFYVADSPKEYEELFYEIIKNKSVAQNKALKAYKEVLQKHTIFQRVETFILELDDFMNGKK